jgi:hypothetical protein
MDKKTFEVINRIAKEHSGKTFGYLNSEDLKNEIWVICLEKLKEFDEDKGKLEHFLRSSVKNRLINRFKDITKTVKSPCLNCPLYRRDEELNCSQYGLDKHLCDKWAKYQVLVKSRNSLLNSAEQKIEIPINLDLSNKTYVAEIKTKVEKYIDDKYKMDFKQFISGGRVSTQKMKKLKKEIFRIMAIVSPGLIESPGLIIED